MASASDSTATPAKPGRRTNCLQRIANVLDERFHESSPLLSRKLRLSASGQDGSTPAVAAAHRWRAALAIRSARDTATSGRARPTRSDADRAFQRRTPRADPRGTSDGMAREKATGAARRPLSHEPAFALRFGAAGPAQAGIGAGVVDDRAEAPELIAKDVPSPRRQRVVAPLRNLSVRRLRRRPAFFDEIRRRAAAGSLRRAFPGPRRIAPPVRSSTSCFMA